MKLLKYGILLMWLLTAFIHAAAAEDPVLKIPAPAAISSSTAAALNDETATHKTAVVGNKDTKRYHLPGMPYYHKVKKYHRVYFASEQEAIVHGYYKAGTGRDLTRRKQAGSAPVRPALPPDAVSSQTEPAPNTAQKPDRQPQNKAQEITVQRPVENPAVLTLSPSAPSAGTTGPAAAAALEISGAAQTPAEKAATEIRAAPGPDTPAAADAKIASPAAHDGVVLKREGASLLLDTMEINTARPRRIEVSYNFDYLDPNSPYGNWNAGQLAFYHTLSPDLTYFLQGALMNRMEGTGGTGTLGAYKGWTPFLYTCTSVTAGTNSSFMPQFRFDHDFNFSVWPAWNINLLAGASYIDYFDDHHSWIFSAGPMISIDQWMAHYRLFYNISNPGTISSFSHLISLGYGREGWRWTHLNISFGKQAYQATYVASAQEINQNSLSLNLRHRHWIGRYYGVFGDIGYTSLEDGYKKYGAGLGAFYEF